MKKRIVFILALIALLSSMICVRFGMVEVGAPGGVDPAKIYGVKMLWNNSMPANDVAVSKDGNYIAVANNSGLYYFALNDSSPKWWYLSPSPAISAAISANGNYTVIGSNNGYVYYFANATAETGNQSTSTWSSYGLGGPVERGTVDISDDGEFVAVGGTGWNVFYYANCTKREGPNQSVTWGNWLSSTDILTVDLSSDGKYLALGGINYSSSRGFVVYYKDANIEPYPTAPDWTSWSSLNSGGISALAVSDDGYGVSAIGGSYYILYYWANATVLSGDPNATWTTWGNYSLFWSVDTSADGNNIVTGSLSVGSLHFWSDARSRQGNQTEDWTRLEPANVMDVAIDDAGNVIAASAQTGLANYTAYFFWSNGTVIDEFNLDQPSPLVSMSGDGRITAIGGPGFDSFYVFELLADTTPPLIKDVYQTPSSDSVYPGDNVTVYANVTDDYSGVKSVILNYTAGNGTWFSCEMTYMGLDVYNGTIPQFPYCTTITYVIMAEDNYNNAITTAELGYEYKYHVILEFQLQTILPLFIISTSLAILIRKRRALTLAQCRK
jgi:hypothetical protein